MTYEAKLKLALKSLEDLMDDSRTWEEVGIGGELFEAVQAIKDYLGED